MSEPMDTTWLCVPGTELCDFIEKLRVLHEKLRPVVATGICQDLDMVRLRLVSLVEQCPQVDHPAQT